MVRPQAVFPIKVRTRDVGSISNLVAQQLKGTFFHTKKWVFSENKRALLCLLQNIGGHVPPVPPGSFVYEGNGV